MKSEGICPPPLPPWWWCWWARRKECQAGGRCCVESVSKTRPAASLCPRTQGFHTCTFCDWGAAPQWKGMAVFLVHLKKPRRNVLFLSRQSQGQHEGGDKMGMSRKDLQAPVSPSASSKAPKALELSGGLPQTCSLDADSFPGSPASCGFVCHLGIYETDGLTYRGRKNTGESVRKLTLQFLFFPFASSEPLQVLTFIVCALR